MDEYILEFGNKNYPLVFGKGDWFDLFFRLNHTKMESYVKVTERLKMITILQKKILQESFSISWIIKNSKPQDFYNKLQNEWQDNVQYLNKFSTSENFGLSDEFKEYRKQLLAIKFLNNIENYKKISGAAAPKALIDELQNTVKNRYVY